MPNKGMIRNINLGLDDFNTMYEVDNQIYSGKKLNKVNLGCVSELNDVEFDEKLKIEINDEQQCFNLCNIEN